MDSCRGCTATTCPADGHNWKPSMQCSWKCSFNSTHHEVFMIPHNIVNMTYTTISKQNYILLWKCHSQDSNLQGLSSVCHALHLYIPHYCFPVAVLRGTPYKNNSIVTLEDIGEGDDALLCITNQTACCRHPYTGVIGNWFFPNGTRVPSSGDQWDFHRTRGQMVVRLHRRRGGVEGVYRCEISDAMNVNQTVYIGVYSASTGE